MWSVELIIHCVIRCMVRRVVHCVVFGQRAAQPNISTKLGPGSAAAPGPCAAVAHAFSSAAPLAPASQRRARTQSKSAILSAKAKWLNQVAIFFSEEMPQMAAPGSPPMEVGGGEEGN